MTLRCSIGCSSPETWCIAEAATVVNGQAYCAGHLRVVMDKQAENASFDMEARFGNVE